MTLFVVLAILNLRLIFFVRHQKITPVDERKMIPNGRRGERKIERNYGRTFYSTIAKFVIPNSIVCFISSSFLDSASIGELQQLVGLLYRHRGVW